MFNKIIFSFLLVVFVSCGSPDKFKNPQGQDKSSNPENKSDGVNSDSGSVSENPSENTPEPKSRPSDEQAADSPIQDKTKDNDGFPPNIDEYGNRTDAGAGSADPCQEDPPGLGCKPYVD